MSQKKYASLSTLQTFLEKLKSLFATKTEVNSKSQVQIIIWEEND